MINDEKIEAAIHYKQNGYNCAQAVLLAYSKELKVDTDILTSISSGLGTGIGCMEGTCGALCGAIMTAGILMNGEKRHIFSKKIFKSFEEKCGATICKDIKGIETDKVLLGCDDCVKNAVLTVSEFFAQENINV